MDKKQSHWISPLLGGLISFSLGVTGIWIGVQGGEISGGIPFIPAETNNLIGRILFAAGGLLCIWISTIAFRELWSVLREDPEK